MRPIPHETYVGEPDPDPTDGAEFDAARSRYPAEGTLYPLR